MTKKSPYTNIRTTEQLYNRTIVVDVAVVVVFFLLNKTRANFSDSNNSLCRLLIGVHDF